MKPIPTLVIILVAFTLGYYTSEYRHAAQAGAVDGESGAGLASTLSAQKNSIVDNAPPIVAIPAPIIFPSSATTVRAPAPAALERIKQLISTGSYREAVGLLNEFLQKNGQNAEALGLLARVYEQLGLHKEAVAIWFRYFNAEVDAQKIETALGYLAKYLLRLASNPIIFGESRDWLIAQLNDLIKLTPDNGELHLQLASMHLKTDDKEQAQYHALMAANQPQTQARAENILAKLTENDAGADVRADEITIKLHRFGSQFLVPVTIEGEGAKLLLDTGASLSGLTSHYVNRHYRLVKNSKPIQLNTASGSVNTILFTVDTFTLGAITFNKHMLASLPMDNIDNFDGLLGVDILGRFDFVIDQDKAELRLRKRL